MFDLMKLLISGFLKVSKGNIKVFGMDMGMLPISYIATFTKEYLLKDKDERTKFYLMGWTSGLIIMRNFEKKTKIKDRRESYLYGMDLASFMGFGEFRTLEYDVGRFALFEIPNNPIVKYFYPSKEPVDYFISAFQAGGGSVAHDRIIENVELECGAVTGKSSCVMLNAILEEHRKRGTYDILQKRIDVEKIFPFQKELFKMYKKGEDDEKIINKLIDILEKF